MEKRKQEEIAWVNKKHTIDLANIKYYSVTRKSSIFVDEWIEENCKDKDVFEMACGNGGYAIKAARVSRTCAGADIAPKSVELAMQRARAENVHDKIKFIVADCENTGLPDNSFDVICVGGALHHMDLDAAYKEARRLLRPGGKFLCIEGLRHNPFIQLYRELTPNLRTKWEADHILGKKQIMLGKSYFENLEISFFHLAAILAVPLRGLPIFIFMLAMFEKIDDVLLKIPGLRWMAWQSVFVLSNPIKGQSDRSEIPN